MIQVKNISFNYENSQTKALNEVDFKIEQGQWVMVVGANGSGKSTLARHLNGLILPQQGEVLVDGLNTRNPEELLKIRQSVAFVFQNPDNQIVATSVEDDIAFGPENLGIAPDEIADRVEKALEITGLTPLRKKTPAYLSGGEKQRLAIAGALAMGAPYLVLDEPTSMLDPQMRAQVLETLEYLHRDLGKGIIYITNLMEEVLLGQRVLVMHKGQLVADSTPRKVFSDYKALAKWGIVPPVLNRISARLAEDGFTDLKDVLTLDEMVDGICNSF